MYSKLARKVKDSKKHKALRTYKNNLTRQIAKEFASQDFRTIVVEDLLKVKDDTKLGHKTMNKMQYWSYRTVLNTLESLSQTEGFSLVKVDPTFTSQTCSKCGTIDATQRKGESYRCKCGMEMHADTNAAINILRRGIYSSSCQENLIL